MNEPGRHPDLPPYADWVASRDADKDGKVTKAEADKVTQDYWDFIDLDKDGVVSKKEWKSNQTMMAAENGLLAFRLGGKGDVGRSGLVWRYQRAVPQLPTPVLYRGVLYMINDGGILTTLDPATGTVLKQRRLRDAVDQYYASPVAGDGKVYFVSRTGIASVVRAGPEQEGISSGDFDDEVMATPALADGRIYLRTRSALYCFGAASAAAPVAPCRVDLRPLRHRDYRFLYAAQFVSFLGSMITYVALPWQTYRLTHSTLAVGLLGLAELLPLLFTAFVGGALADSVDRRRMVIATEVGL